MKTLLYKLSSNVAKIFRGRNLVWHLVAIALTVGLVFSGFDWYYFQATRSAFLRSIFFPAVEVGAFVPLFGTFIFIAISFFKKSAKFTNTVFALAQAALLGFVISDLYKSFTGRVGPPGFLTQDFATDISHVFRFGILRGGVFFGWPSSHTTVATAMAITLMRLFPEKKWVKFLAIAYALYVGVGVSMTIHWFSDFAAGVIIGSVVGSAVGKSFRERKGDRAT